MEQTSALERAVSLTEKNQGRLTILEVIQPAREDYLEDLKNIHIERLESLVEPHRGRIEIRFDLLFGTQFLEVIRTVLRDSHDLVMKTAENPDFLKRLFGTGDMHLLRKCPCPVWIMKPSEKPAYTRIMAAVDFDPLKPTETEQALNREILDLASSIALAESASLHLIHAWEAFAERIALAERNRLKSGTGKVEGIGGYIERERTLHWNGLYALGETLRERIGSEAYDHLSPRFHLPEGPAKKVIGAMAAELQADLLVMGTVGCTGISGFFIGNTAEAILDQVSCSVLALKPPGFTTPVRIVD